MIGRRSKVVAPTQPVVALTAVVDELVRSHNYNGDPQARLAHAARVRAVAAEQGINADVDWLPSMTPTQAASVLHAIVTAPDPDERWLELMAEEHDHRLPPLMTPARAYELAQGNLERMQNLLNLPQGEVYAGDAPPVSAEVKARLEALDASPYGPVTHWPPESKPVVDGQVYIGGGGDG